MDKYRKLKVIGKGSFGFAVLVQSIEDRQKYVMKIIDVSKMDRKQREDAVNEVHVLKAMRHPYIITYKESFMDKRCLCIVMDYADGGDLYTKIANQKKVGKVQYSEDQILDWFVQMALAIKHIHDRKILHRDLKTQNIFMNQNGTIKIGDFGIARVLQHTYDCASTAIGTPYYLSPEICQEKPYNQKSDIWSLGCILYEMVTLRHAFDANSMKGLVLKILRGQYPQIPATYSQNLKDLLADMLIKDPNKRPSMRKILEKDFLSARISKLLTATIAKNEFTSTFIQRHLQDGQEEEKEGCIEISNEGISQQSNQIQTSMPNQPKLAIKGIQNNQQKKIRLGSNSSQSQPGGALQRQPPGITVSHSQQQLKGIPGQSDDSRVQNHSVQNQGSRFNVNFTNKSNDGQQYNNYVEGKLPPQQFGGDVIKASGGKQLGPGQYQQQPQFNNNRSKTVNDDSSDEDQLHEEPPDMRVYPEFLKNLPGVQASDSMAYRIEALRVYLEQQLGDQPFIAAYQHLSNLNDDDEQDPNYIEGIVGNKRMKFIPLIHHLIVCEDSYYQN